MAISKCISKEKVPANAKIYVKIFVELEERIMNRGKLILEFVRRTGYGYDSARFYLAALEVYDTEDTTNALFIRHGNSSSTVEYTGLNAEVWCKKELEPDVSPQPVLEPQRDWVEIEEDKDDQS